jgi:23S rRNA pseudouridine2605 synthase
MPEPEPVRLQKYLADCGLCSRRTAEQWILEGRVQVDDAIPDLGLKVTPGREKVFVDGRRIRSKLQAKPVVLMMNKPKGYLCTNEDPNAEKTVYELVPAPWNRLRLFCAGRLDKDSTGLLILTNDGELCNRIMHPSGGVIKRYRVRVHRDFDRTIIPKLLRGITHEGERLYAERIIPATTGPDPERWMEIHLSQGRKREIRRMLEAFGFFVEKLERFQLGSLQLRRVPRGSLKELNERQIAAIFREPKPTVD